MKEKGRRLFHSATLSETRLVQIRKYGFPKKFEERELELKLFLEDNLKLLNFF